MNKREEERWLCDIDRDADSSSLLPGDNLVQPSNKMRSDRHVKWTNGKGSALRFLEPPFQWCKMLKIL